MRKILNTLSALLLFLTTIFVTINYKTLPEKLPMKFNFVGDVTRYGSKYEVIFMIILLFAIYMLLEFVKKQPSMWNTMDSKNLKKYEITANMLSRMQLFLVSTFSYTIYTVCTITKPTLLLLPAMIIYILGDVFITMHKLAKY